MEMPLPLNAILTVDSGMPNKSATGGNLASVAGRTVAADRVHPSRSQLRDCQPAGGRGTVYNLGQAIGGKVESTTTIASQLAELGDAVDGDSPARER